MSLTTTPTVLTSQNSSLSWHSLFEFRLRSETSTEAIYDLWNYANNAWHNSPGVHGIKVTFDTNTWSDDGSDNPSDVVPNGLLIDVQVGSANQYQFTKPTSSTASWLSSGGGTGTEGSVLPSGSRYINDYKQLVFTISSESPSSDGTIAYKIFRGIKDNLSQYTVVTHSNGTSTEYNVGFPKRDDPGIYYDYWELRLESTSGLYESQVLASYSANKKVFCNFW